MKYTTSSKRTVPVTVLTIAIATILLTQGLATTSFNFMNEAFGHVGKLVNVNGKDYWIWVDAKYPAVINVLGGGDLYVYEADPQDPLNPDSNKTKPVDGLSEILKLNVIASGQNKSFPIETIWNGTAEEAGHYESHFIHTAENTPYEYELFGNWNGTQFSVSWTCTPGVEPDYKQTNETTTLSEGVLLKADAGQFGCPKPMAELSIPESSGSNVEVQTNTNNTTPSSNNTNAISIS
jgi:hypothetical protein